MIIYFEGMSLAGKTTIITKLSQRYKAVVSVPELPDGVNLSQIEDTKNYCERNDEEKCLLAQNFNKENNFVCVDRSYLSTIAFEFVRYITINDTFDRFLSSITWYHEKLRQGKLMKPDLYIFVNTKEDELNKRSLKNNKEPCYHSNKKLVEFYKSFWNTYESEVPVFEINGEEDINTLVEDIYIYMKQMQENYLSYKRNNTMGTKMEKEVNYLVKDREGILTVLDKYAKQEILKARFHYFDPKNKEDKSYLRLEEYEGKRIPAKVLTIKSAPITIDGIKTRQEVTIPVNTIEPYFDMCRLIGFEYQNSKSKIRHSYEVNSLHITVDEWYKEDFKIHIEDRLEIEGEDQELMRAFAKKLEPFIHLK